MVLKRFILAAALVEGSSTFIGELRSSECRGFMDNLAANGFQRCERGIQIARMLQNSNILDFKACSLEGF
jgi:hypothetical protein